MSLLPTWLPRSLRAKSIILFLLPALLTLGLFIFYAGVRLQAGLDQSLGRRLSSIAQAATPLLPPQYLLSFQKGDRSTRTYRNLKKRMLRLKKSTGVRRIYVFSPQHRSLLDTGDVPIGRKYVELDLEKFELRQVFKLGRPRSSTLFRDQKGQYYKTGYAPLRDQGKVVAAIAVEGSAGYFTILRSTQRSLLFFSFFALALVVLTGLFFSTWLVAPINKLVDAARGIGEGRLEETVPVENEDEIGFLALTMEEMRKNILARDNQMQMMLSGIAHEVRNPLGGMELFTGILLEELEDEPEKASHVKRVQREVRYLADVVNSFLSFARPQALDIRKYDLEDFLMEMRMVLSADLMQKDLDLRLTGEFREKKLPFDKSRLQQTILNLVQNAIHASPMSEKIELNVEFGEEWCTLKLLDKGEGIPPETLANIFEPFFTTKEKGTGLGLPLARRLVEQHGGTLDIESVVGEGTTVIMALPVNSTL
jgi:signal transduction histidine kinase